jgi:acetolactate synthase-1/2/3 large subunit
MLGAELIARMLEAAGVEQFFGVTGGANLDVVQALGPTRLRYTLVRHEQVAATMADGYARVSGRPAVAMGQVTGGALNLLNGVAIAHRDGVPLIALTANEPFERLQREAWQTLDVVPIYQPVTKWSRRVTQPTEIPHLVFGALARCVSGAPGAVHLDLCRNVTRAEVDEPTTTRAMRHAETLRPLLVPADRPRPSDKSLDRAAELLAVARRPVLLAGGGATWSEAGPQVQSLAERIGAAVLLSNTARGLVREDHPACLGPAGRFGTPSADRALREADVVLSVGSRLSDLTTRNWSLISPEARVVHLNVVADELARQFPLDVALIGDARTGLEALLERVAPPAEPLLTERRRWVAGLKEAYERDLAAFFEVRSEATVLPHELALAVRRAFPEQAVFTHGAGIHPTWTSRLPVQQPRTYLKAMGSASMGFAFPAALGAKLARPDLPVVALVGDGDFMMVCQDLETAVRERLNVVVVIFNNFGLIAEKIRGSHLDPSVRGADFGNPDFSRFAETFGAAGRRVERPDQLDDAVAWAAGQERPVLLDVMVDRDAEPMWLVQA